MNSDRFKNYEQHVRELVLRFERQRGDACYFDVDQLEIIADYYLEVNDVDGLEAAVLCGERLFPSNTSIRLRRAHLLSVQGQYPQALMILEELERTESDNTDVAYALGAIHSMLGHPERAISYFLHAASDGYQLDMIYGNVADEYFKLGQIDDAVKYYKKSIRLNPEEERSLYNLLCTFNEQGLNLESQQFFSQLVEEHPYSKWGWYCLGLVCRWLSLYEQSVDAFEYAIAIDSAWVDAYTNLSESYRLLGNHSRAIQALHDALPHATDRPYILYLMGHLYFEKRNYHTASTYYHDAIKEDPSYAAAWNELGHCSELLGYVDEAAGYFRRAIDLDPDLDENWLSLADLFISSLRFAEACSLLESSRMEALERFNFDSRLIYCYFRLGRRGRLFDLLQADASAYGVYYNNLFAIYPDLSSDPEIVNSISIFSSL